MPLIVNLQQKNNQISNNTGKFEIILVYLQPIYFCFVYSNQLKAMSSRYLLAHQIRHSKIARFHSIQLLLVKIIRRMVFYFPMANHTK